MQQQVVSIVAFIASQLKSYKWPVLLCLVGVVLILGGLFLPQTQATQSQIFPKESLVEPEAVGQIEIRVDVAGAVAQPGAYSLLSNHRVEDAIKMAGGFKAEANKLYIAQSLNLSQKLTDGQKIYIPFASETGVIQSGQQLPTTNSEAKKIINLNSDSAEMLESLPGVGAVTAQKIIDGRPYSQVSDLIAKKIVSNSVYQKIRGLVSVN